MSEQDDPAQELPETYTADQVAEIRRAADQRVMLAELKTRAMAAGMIDLDGLRLLDLSGVKLGEHGEVSVPDGFFDAARKAKPYLFGRAAAGSTARAPTTTPPKARNAVEMDFGEWQAARAVLLKRV